jgi:hypothetical protein
MSSRGNGNRMRMPFDVVNINEKRQAKKIPERFVHACLLGKFMNEQNE